MSKLYVALVILIAGCGPTASAMAEDESGTGSDASDESGEPVDAALEPYTLVWEAEPVACGVVEQVRVDDDDTLLLAGSRSITSGWVARYDRDGVEQWFTESDSPFRALDNDSAGMLWAGGEGVVLSYRSDGAPSVDAPMLELPANVRIDAISSGSRGWLLGGSVGEELPHDAFLSQVDAGGTELVRFDAPLGSGNVSSDIAAIESDGSVSVACGTRGSGEWGQPWLQILDGETSFDFVGEGNDGLGVRWCTDVAVEGNRIARSESGDQGGVVVTDSRGEMLWEIRDLERPTAIGFLPSGGIVAAGREALYRMDADGSLLTTTELVFDDWASVRDLAVLSDGSVVVAGTSGSESECAQSWLALFE